MSKKLAITGDKAGSVVKAATATRPRKASANPFRDIVPVRSTVKSKIPDNELRAAIREIMERCEPEKL